MSEATTAAITAFTAVWKNAFAKILAQLGAESAVISDSAEPSLQPASAENTSVLSAKFSGGGCLQGQLLWTCEKSVAVQCAQLLMSEPVNAAVDFSDMHADGFLEFMRQVAGEAALAWKAERELPTELVYQNETPAVLNSQSTFSFTIDAEKCKGLVFRLDLNPELCTALSALPPAPLPKEEPKQSPAQAKEPAKVEAPPQVSEQPTEENMPASESDSAQSPASNLDLILDVQLEATIRFGEREMLLQDVFGLMPGAVVELNQLVNEPAELLVAGRLVAKGEVVVVDGNFGLRVTEVVSRSQRAEMLSLE
jgi:flagellar motor switch protein FliN/FliY